MAGPPVVFAGPSVGRARAKAALPGAVLLPPARCGDVLAALRLRPQAIVLIDGLYDTTPAPWHKELLWALEAGIPVVGAASMGALRAAELHQFGMVGVGRVFEGFRDGRWHAEDEVAVLQAGGPGGGQAVTEPLADIRAAVAALADVGVITARDADRAVAAAGATHFSERALAGALRGAGLDQATVARAVRRAGGWSQKRDDAEAALHLAAAGLSRPRLPEPLARTVHIVRLAAQAPLRPFGHPDPALPAAERLLAADPDLARAAAVAGGLLRAAEIALTARPPTRTGPAPHRTIPPPAVRSPAVPPCGVPAASDGHGGEPGRLLAAAAAAARRDSHPAAAASAARLELLAARLHPAGWQEPAPAGAAGPEHEALGEPAALRELAGLLAGPAASGTAVEVMAAAAATALALTRDPEAGLTGRPAGDNGPEPSQDAIAEAARLLAAPGGAGRSSTGGGGTGGGGGAVSGAAALGRLRAAAGLVELVLLGGAVTARAAPHVDPFGTPLLDGLALLRAADTGPARARVTGRAGVTEPPRAR